MFKAYLADLATALYPWVEPLMPWLYRLAISISVMLADDAAMLSIIFIQ